MMEHGKRSHISSTACTFCSRSSCRSRCRCRSSKSSPTKLERKKRHPNHGSSRNSAITAISSERFQDWTTWLSFNSSDSAECSFHWIIKLHNISQHAIKILKNEYLRSLRRPHVLWPVQLHLMMKALLKVLLMSKKRWQSYTKCTKNMAKAANKNQALNSFKREKLSTAGHCDMSQCPWVFFLHHKALHLDCKSNFGISVCFWAS